MNKQEEPEIFKIRYDKQITLYNFHMRKIYYLMASVALMSAFTACNNEDEVASPINIGSALHVETAGLAGVKTKAGIMENAFTNGEKLGLYIYRGSNEAAIDADNRAYNDASSTGLTPTVNVP